MRPWLSNVCTRWLPPKGSCGSISRLLYSNNWSASRRWRARGRKELQATLAQFDAALVHTRPERVRALAEGPPPHLVERLGQVPGSPAGRAVWCHYALGIEAVLDCSDASGSPPTRQSPIMRRARQEVAIADRLLGFNADLAEPVSWAELAGHAAVLRTEAQRLVTAPATVDRLRSAGRRVQPSRDMGTGTAQAGPQLSL